MLSVISYRFVRFKLNVAHHKKEFDSQALRESRRFIRTLLFRIGASEIECVEGAWRQRLVLRHTRQFQMS